MLAADTLREGGNPSTKACWSKKKIKQDVSSAANAKYALQMNGRKGKERKAKERQGFIERYHINQTKEARTHYEKNLTRSFSAKELGESTINKKTPTFPTRKGTARASETYYETLTNRARRISPRERTLCLSVRKRSVTMPAFHNQGPRVPPPQCYHSRSSGAGTIHPL